MKDTSLVTKKHIMNVYKNVIKVPYNNQYCIKCFERVFHQNKLHTEGIYGWNCDIYTLNLDTVFTTGYRSFGNIKIAYDYLVNIEDECKNACESGNMQKIIEAATKFTLSLLKATL